MAQHYPAGNGTEAVEFTVDLAGFRDAFVADLPADVAATQRPVSELAFSEPSGPSLRTSRPGRS